MTQPQVARLERGDVNPSMDTLVRVAAGLGIELTISVTPANRKPRLVTKRALANNMVGGIRTERAHVLVAASWSTQRRERVRTRAGRTRDRVTDGSRLDCAADAGGSV
jgi:transcriptional regulator with XRE-family HTH domain